MMVFAKDRAWKENFQAFLYLCQPEGSVQKVREAPERRDTKVADT